ncbi:MAG: hypothetical protein ACI8RZ_006262 [Myxococcota bacterium]|jgi:hypothetical protein
MGVPITRRGVLLSGALFGAALLIGRVIWLAPPAPGMRVLSAREASIIEAIAAVLFPPGTFSVHGGDGGTAPRLDVLLDEMLDELAADGFRYLLRAMEVGTLVARGVPFSGLPVDEAREVIDIWFSEEPAPRRMVSDSFKVLLGISFLNRPEVVAEIGWRRGCIDGDPS